MLQGFKDLKVYQVAYQLGLDIYEITKTFPPDERFSMISQMRRAARSVAANIGEGYRKRQYPKMFVAKMADSDGESAEMLVWIDYAKDHAYINQEVHKDLTERYLSVGRMLGGILAHPEKFLPRKT
jgi:four helix bundle protein